MSLESPAIAAARGKIGPGTIDAEIHNVVPSSEALFPYLTRHWRETITQTLFKGVADASFPRGAPTTTRPGVTRAEGQPAASTLDQIKADILDRGVAGGILTCFYAVDSLRNPDAAIALSRAANDWQIAEWLEKEPRLRGSLVVPSQLPREAAREIERVGDHPGFVQVLLPVRSHLPYGNRIHHEMFEAIARKHLVVGLHFGGHPGNPPTPSGWPSYFVEEYVDMAGVFASQMTSMITEGLFDEFPALHVAMLESGFTWIPAHLWRFDKEWRNLRRLVPWVRRPPSAYVREHFRVTVQPLDAPRDPQQMVDLVDQLESEEMLMYGSDYPHLHLRDPEADLLAYLTPGHAARVRGDNARTLYRL
ncbi:MAG: amidohydrolase [Chloroflexi bacterium]|nr:amidohydrolase [Chloroflexota bacterium]